MNEITENRAEIVSNKLIFDLSRVGAGTLHSVRARETLEQLPKELSIEEIDVLCLRVESFTEMINPSNDGYSHGRKNSSGLVRNLGFLAVIKEDAVTASNSAEQLKSFGGVGNRIASFMIKREIKKQNKKVNSLQTS